MFCSRCGTQNSSSSFCTNCGTQLQASTNQPVGVNSFTSGSAQTSQSNTLSILAIIFGSISFLLLPVLFGGVGLVLAIVAKNKNESKANTAILVSSLGLGLGIVFGAIVGTFAF